MHTWTSHVTSSTVTSIEMYLRTGFPYLYISIYRYSHLNKLSMVSLFCSSGTFSKEKCNIRYLHVTRGSRNIFPWRLVKKRHPVASELGRAKVLQTRILTEKDLILACTGQFNEDGTTMTIYPRHRVEHAHGMFWRPSRKCAHPLHGNRKGKPERGVILEMSKCNTFVPVGAGKAGIYTCLPCFKILWCSLGLVETWSQDRGEEGMGVEDRVLQGRLPI